MTAKQAKKLILALVDLGQVDASVTADVGIYTSKKKGQENTLMELSEVEELYDTVYRSAFKQLTGEAIPDGEDAADFINS